MLPEARTEKLVIEQLPDEVLVYDLDRDRAHCLNRTAAIVWRHCDGKHSVADLTQLLRAEVDAPVDEDWVQVALQRLDRAHLLRDGVPKGARKGVTRRRALLAFALLPAVITIVAPTAAQAATCVLSGNCCCPGDKCCEPGDSCKGSAGLKRCLPPSGDCPPSDPACLCPPCK